jgi:hypothetical protein
MLIQEIGLIVLFTLLSNQTYGSHSLQDDPPDRAQTSAPLPAPPDAPICHLQRNTTLYIGVRYEVVTGGGQVFRGNPVIVEKTFNSALKAMTALLEAGVCKPAADLCSIHPGPFGGYEIVRGGGAIFRGVSIEYSSDFNGLVSLLKELRQLKVCR